jgi:hypothetical protein
MKLPAFMTRARAIWAGVCVLVAVLLFIAGGLWGFAKGFNAALYASADPYEITTVLRFLRLDETENAVAILESTLDCAIADTGLFEDSYRSPLNVLLYTELGSTSEEARAGLMAIVVEYRKEHPSPAINKHVRKLLRETLERYDNRGEHNPRVQSDAAVEDDDGAEAK